MTVKEHQKNEDKKKQALSYFVSKGYTPEAASGIVGNLVHESNLNTSAEGDIGYKGGSSFGVAQWRGDRLQRLKKMYGDNWTDFSNQLEFVDWELNNTHKSAGEKLRQSKNVHDAGRVFSDYYEIPQKKYNENKQRQLEVNRVATLMGKTADVENTYSLPQQETTIVTNLPKSEESTNIAQEPQVQQNEQTFLQEYQNTFTQPQQEQEIVEEAPQYQPQKSVSDIFNEVSQFVDTDIFAQQGGKFAENELAFLSEIAIKDNQGYWNPKNKGKIVEINSPNISMKNLDYSVLGISKETGEQKLMMPNQEYTFKNTQKVIEINQK